MGRKKNSFSKAIKHLKSKNIDEKLEILNEIPTNNTSSIYSVVPNSITVGVDVTRTVPDYSSIDFGIDGNDGRDTSGLFDESGNSKFIAPPGDNSYILGPMAAMYYTWSTPWTKIGYIRESDRRMVNLGTIYSTLHLGGDFNGKLSDWDGSLRDGNGTQVFYANGQLTLEQAQWFLNTPKKDNAGNDPANANYRAFYPGPPSNAPDEFGRYLCTMTGTPKGTKDEIDHEKKAPMGLQGSDNFSAILDRIGSFGNNLKDKFGNIASNIKDFFVNAFTNIADKIGDSIENAATIVSDLATNVGSGIEDVIDWAQDTSKDVIDWARETDWESVGNAATTIINVADAALAVTSIVGIFTPEPVTTAGGAAGLASLALKFQNALKVAKGSKGLAAGLKGIKIGATGLKKGGFDNLRADLPGGPAGIHKGSSGLLSPGGKGVYSAPTVGGVRPQNNFRPGTGGGRYSHGGQTSNPITNFFDKATGKTPEAPGGVVGSVVPGGAKGTGFIEPQSVVTPKQFQKGTQLFNDIVNGKYPNSATANDLRNQGLKAGFKPGQSSIPFSDLPVLKNEVDYTGLYLKEEEQYSLRSILGEDESDKQDLMIMRLMNVPGFRKKLPAIIKAMEEEIQIVELYRMINGFDQSEGKTEDPFRKKQQKKSFNAGNNKRSNSTVKESISESRKTNIMKTLKDPVVIPETKQKSYKVKPGRRFKKSNYHQGMDKLIGDVKPQKSFKKPQNMWSQGWQEYNARSSQDKKNIVLEKIGESKHAWKYMLEHGTMMDAKNLEEFWGKNPDFYSYFFNGKKYKTVRKEQVKGDYVVFLVDESGAKSSMLQSELNIKLIEEEEKKMLAEYNKLNNIESIPYEKDPLFKKVSKRLKKEIDYPEKPAKKGYPNQPPPKLGPDGFHPDFGKKYKYDKLDPISATTMSNAPTGNPEIDANVKKQKTKRTFSKMKKFMKDA